MWGGGGGTCGIVYGVGGSAALLLRVSPCALPALASRKLHVRRKKMRRNLARNSNYPHAAAAALVVVSISWVDWQGEERVGRPKKNGPRFTLDPTLAALWTAWRWFLRIYAHVPCHCSSFLTLSRLPCFLPICFRVSFFPVWVRSLVQAPGRSRGGGEEGRHHLPRGRDADQEGGHAAEREQWQDLRQPVHPLLDRFP